MRDYWIWLASLWTLLAVLTWAGASERTITIAAYGCVVVGLVWVFVQGWVAHIWLTAEYGFKDAFAANGYFY